LIPDCGVTHLTEEEMRNLAKSHNPGAAEEVQKIDFQYFREDQFLDAIKEDVLTLRDQKSLSGLKIHGFSLDNATGALEEVVIQRLASL
jgi:carbonic anhydrase